MLCKKADGVNQDLVATLQGCLETIRPHQIQCLKHANGFDQVLCFANGQREN
jgi:hypothetical protein